MQKKKLTKKVLAKTAQQELLATLRSRFEKNPKRHKGVAWEVVLKKLLAQPEKLWSLAQMEATGGEPDVVVLGNKSKDITFVDCSVETPKERRSLCFDEAALASRRVLPNRSCSPM